MVLVGYWGGGVDVSITEVRRGGWEGEGGGSICEGREW